MQFGKFLIPFALLLSVPLHAQEEEKKRKGPGPEDIPTSSLISRPGPSFRVPQAEVEKESKVIVYGDQRFTGPANTKVTSPTARRLLVLNWLNVHLINLP